MFQQNSCSSRAVQQLCTCTVHSISLNMHVHVHVYIHMYTTYKLDAEPRKLCDLESQGPWGCSVPSAARTLLQGPRLSKLRSFWRQRLELCQRLPSTTVENSICRSPLQRTTIGNTSPPNQISAFKPYSKHVYCNTSYMYIVYTWIFHTHVLLTCSATVPRETNPPVLGGLLRTNRPSLAHSTTGKPMLSLQ